MVEGSFPLELRLGTLGSIVQLFPVSRARRRMDHSSRVVDDRRTVPSDRRTGSDGPQIGRSDPQKARDDLRTGWERRQERRERPRGPARGRRDFGDRLKEGGGDRHASGGHSYRGSGDCEAPIGRPGILPATAPVRLARGRSSEPNRSRFLRVAVPLRRGPSRGCTTVHALSPAA